MWGVSNDAGMTVCMVESKSESRVGPGFKYISLQRTRERSRERWKMEAGREWRGSMWLWGGCRGLGMGRVPACFISGWQDFALPFSLSLPLSFILCYSFSTAPIALPPPTPSLLLPSKMCLGERKGLDKFKGKKSKTLLKEAFRSFSQVKALGSNYYNIHSQAKVLFTYIKVRIVF